MEKKERNRKEKINKLWILKGMNIFLFLSDEASQRKKRMMTITLPEARSTPGAGLIASWKGR
jgi:hypothetical protein